MEYFLKNYLFSKIMLLYLASIAYFFATQGINGFLKTKQELFSPSYTTKTIDLKKVKL